MTFVRAVGALAMAGALALFWGNAKAADHKVGDVFQDCEHCPSLTVVPSGKFVMGSEKEGRPAEMPLVDVTIAKPFAIGRFEVTFDEYDFCNEQGGCDIKPFDRGWGRGTRPVHTVTFEQIQQYLRWISKTTGKTYRLPSEEEWEYAARAGTTTEYWFGDVMIAGEVNCRDCATEWSNVKSAPVGSFKPNPWGLYDVHGNEFEIVQDCWNETHVGAPTDGSALMTGECGSHVSKGGAWYYLPKVARSASRARNDARVASYIFGFRVVRELD